jgi:magnesium chelatase family protein
LVYDSYPYRCPCGFFGDPVKECSCTPIPIARYQKKISGPLIDRIDIHVEVYFAK